MSAGPTEYAASEDVSNSTNSDRQPVALAKPDASVLAEFSDDLLERISFWLDWQSKMLSGVLSASVYLTTPSSSTLSTFGVHWPDNGSYEPGLRKYAQEAMQSGDSVVYSGVGGAKPHDIVASVIRDNSRDAGGSAVRGAVVFALSTRSASQQGAVLHLLGWCVTWLEQQFRTEMLLQEDMQALHIKSFELISQPIPLPVAGNQLCNFLSRRFDCSFVGLGVCGRLNTGLVSLSNQLQFDRRSQRITEIELAMQECQDRASMVIFPITDSSAETFNSAHRKLLAQIGQQQVCSIPIMLDTRCIAVLTFASDTVMSFEADKLDQLSRIATGIAPVIQIQQQANASLGQKIGITGEKWVTRLFGPGHTGFKVSILTAALFALLLSFITIDHRVSTTAVIEGAVQQAIVSPVDGFLKSVSVRAGDEVAAGQLLATLDDRDLLLEKVRWDSEKNRQSKEYQKAWADRNAAQVTIFSARMAQSDAEARLVENRIEQSRLRAPFAGMLVAGDPGQLVGAPLSKGQTLFEISPLEKYRVILNVSETQIGQLHKGQSGHLRIASLPGEPIAFKVTRIFPVAQNKNGRSTYRVEANVVKALQSLRPGLEGVARVTVGRGSAASVWTHRLREKLSIWFWHAGF